MKASENPYREVTWLPTGYSNLDKILGGGIPLRRITEISGRYGLGKTTLALSMVASAQGRGLPTLWVDTEFAFDEKYAVELGVDLTLLDFVNEHLAEDNLNGTEEWVSSNRNALVVLDSIGGLLPRVEAEKDSDSKVIGAQAKLVSTFCRKIVPLLAMNNVGLVVCNHEFADLMSGRLMTSGGAKLGYHKSIWLRLTPANKRVTQGERQIGEVVEAEVRKNKLANTMKQSCELTMIYGNGFMKGADTLNEAKEKLFKKRGQFFYWDEEKIARGERGLLELFRDESFLRRVRVALGQH